MTVALPSIFCMFSMTPQWSPSFSHSVARAVVFGCRVVGDSFYLGGSGNLDEFCSAFLCVHRIFNAVVSVYYDAPHVKEISAI